MELTTLEIAAMCQRTERTVQRWLSTGRLKATHLLGNRYEVAEDDLQPFLPHEVVDSISERISALEARIEALEAMLQSAPATRTPRGVQIAHTPTTNSTLPDEWVDLPTLLKQHPGANRSTVIRNLKQHIKKGHWIVDGHEVTNALDEAGQAEFMKRYG